MYLASFDTDRDQLLQGCVRLAFPPLNDSALNNNWRRELERLLRFADSVKDITISLRLMWGRTKTLEHTLLISAPAHQEPDLRRYFGSFIRLENIFEGSITVPLTREEHDALVLQSSGSRFRTWGSFARLRFQGRSAAERSLCRS